MKKSTCYILIIFFCLCLSACQQKPHLQIFNIADSLINVQPDSAIVFLKSMEHRMDSASEAQQMRFQLLCIKANDKAYIPHTSDSLILSLLHYYTKKRDKTFLPEVYYYAGRVYRDLGDAPQALNYFEKAVNAMGKAENYPLRSRLSSQIGILFLYQDMYEEALEKFKNAYKYDTLLKDTAGIIFDLRDMASCYRYMEQTETSLHYYQKAYDLASAIQHSRLMNIVQNQMASLYIELKQYNLAKKFLLPSLNKLCRPSKSAVYSIASKLYHQTGHTDSAQYYYKELLKCGTIYAKKAACSGLAEIALRNKNPKDALLYLQLFMEYTDSVQRITHTETVHKMRSLYNYQLREKENMILKNTNNRQELIIVCISASCLIILILSFAYLQYSRRKRLQLSIHLEKLRNLQKEHYRKSASFIERNRNLIKELEEQLTNAEAMNTSLKIQLQKQKEIILYTNKQAELDLDRREIMRTTLLDSDICKTFKDRIRSSSFKITTEEWCALEKAVNDTYEGFSENLHKLHRFSKYEFHICLLIKINIPPADMAKLTNHTKESISATRRRLYEKVFSEKGSPKLWDDFILSL